MLIFEPVPGKEPEVDRVLRHARARAEAAGWHCWAYRNEIASGEITLFLEGPLADGPGRPIFGSEIEELRALAGRFERVRSLVEYPIEELTA
ncbi:MAG: hypothetical protein ACHQU1_07915 [Gemmatimonadales bacterium]